MGIKPLKGVLGGAELTGPKRAGATQKNFFAQIFTSNPKIKLLYIFNTYALRCSRLNLRLHDITH